MKNVSALIATLCLVSIIACGERETDLAEGPELLDPASETIVTETTGTIDDAYTLEEIGEPVTATEVEPSPAAESTPSAPSPAREPAPQRTAAPAPSSSAQPVPAAEQAPPPQRETPARTPEPEPEVRAPQPEPTPTPAPAQTSSKLPKTHTVSKDGVMHAPGFDNPVTKCGACHGKDLQGGRVGVSCLDCHESKWD